MGGHTFGHQHIIEEPVGIELVGPLGVHGVQPPPEIVGADDLAMPEIGVLVLGHKFFDKVMEA